MLVPSEQVTTAWGLLDMRAKRDLQLPAPQGLTLDELVDDNPLFYRDGFDPSQVADGPEWWIYQPSDWIRHCHRDFQAASCQIDERVPGYAHGGWRQRWASTP